MSDTLLEIVQEVLTSVSGDEVDSISDTTESLQIAGIVRSVYKNLTTEDDFPEDIGVFELEASGDSAQPCLMTLPSNATRLDWVRYNKDTLTYSGTEKYEDIHFVEMHDFFNTVMSGRISTASNIVKQTVTVNNATTDFLVRNDVHPTYYTVLGDSKLLFDSFDSTVDTTLQKSKTVCGGAYISSFSLVDSFVPFSDAHNCAILRNAVRAQVWEDLKSTRNFHAEKQEKRSRIAKDRKLGVAGRLVDPIFSLKNYGRK